MKQLSYEQLLADGRILFSCIAGSIAYGTNTPTSDVDIRYVYVQPVGEVLGVNYVPQVNNDTNDITGYEIRRFLELLRDNNPNILELIAMPQDVVRYKNPLFDLILENRDKFLTLKIRDTLGGYARQQIQKARGQVKMMNWEKDRMIRKGPEDFCFVVTSNGTGTVSLKKWIEIQNKPLPWYQRFFWHLIEPEAHPEHFDLTHLAVSKLDNMRDTYALYVDRALDYTRGIVSDTGQSNELRLTAIPEGIKPVGVLYYNKDGYSMHCKEYKRYEEWVAKRNDARWVDSQNHGQMVDGKNLLHCVRLLRMSREVASGQGLIIRRPDREELLAIRRGEVDLNALLETSEAEIKEIDRLYDQATLPREVPEQLIHELLIRIRHGFDPWWL